MPRGRGTIGRRRPVPRSLPAWRSTGRAVLWAKYKNSQYERILAGNNDLFTILNVIFTFKCKYTTSLIFMKSCLSATIEEVKSVNKLNQTENCPQTHTAAGCGKTNLSLLLVKFLNNQNVCLLSMEWCQWCLDSISSSNVLKYTTKS